MCRYKCSDGFSLIEIAVVLIIFGLTMLSIVPGLRSYYENRQFYTTAQNIREVDNAIKAFFIANGRYPCPAVPNLAPADANYGIEQCRAITSDPPVDPCPAGLTCTEVGSRDANGRDGEDPVVIGVVPMRTLDDSLDSADFKFSFGRDGNNMQFAYAVSELMTDPSLNINNPANIQLGAIALRDEFNNSITIPDDSVHYVVLSFGDNSTGATSLEGVGVGGCTIPSVTVGDPPVDPPSGNNLNTSGIRVEIENCDNNDAIFVKALKSTADNDGYYDDQLYYGAPIVSELWRRQTGVTAETHLYNTNFGDVGVGLDDPSARLHINGGLKAETRIEADNLYCDETSDNCLNAEALGGDIIADCPDGQAAVGFDENGLECRDLFGAAFTSSLPLECPPGQFLVGFSNLGTEICEIP